MSFGGVPSAPMIMGITFIYSIISGLLSLNPDIYPLSLSFSVLSEYHMGWQNQQ